MAAESEGFDVRAILISSAEFFFLLGLWMIFVSMPKLDELLVGIGASLISAFADGVVKAKKFATFYPHLRLLALVFWEPWYALKGTGAVLRAFARRLQGKGSKSQFRAVPFSSGGQDPQSAARRALATILTTISPDTVVIGIDREKHLLLLHEISPAETPLITCRLGAKA